MSRSSTLSGSKKYQQWFEEKCDNFLNWLLETSGKYSSRMETPPAFFERLDNQIKEYQQDETKKSLFFSKIARTQLLHKTPFLMDATFQAQQFFDMNQDQKNQALDAGIEQLKVIQSYFTLVIEYFESHKEESLEDLTKLCGYINIIYGPLLVGDTK